MKYHWSRLNSKTWAHCILYCLALYHCIPFELLDKFLLKCPLQVELFCVNHMINCSLESTEEFICMEFRFSLRDNGMRAAFQLLHMVLEVSVMFFFPFQLCCEGEYYSISPCCAALWISFDFLPKPFFIPFVGATLCCTILQTKSLPNLFLWFAA